MGRDQNDTAARVVHHGAGVRLSPKAAAPKIRAAIERVLADPALRAGAARLQAAIRAQEGCVDPIASLERIAGRSPRASARAGAASAEPEPEPDGAEPGSFSLPTTPEGT